MHGMSVCTSGDKNNSVNQDFVGSTASPTAGVAASVMSRVSSSGTRGAEHDEGLEKVTRGGVWEPIKNSLPEFGLYPEIDPTPLSSSSAKIA
jgi:hypothetical protein